jgi:L-seryl-tRNA(Ser) seleniumtransferase
MAGQPAIKSNSDPYRALGLRPFINCCSVRTIHGGSLMLPSVRTAVAAASQCFVNLDELMEAAGARIAELTGAEWGIVTCGSAAALTLATAACVAGNDPVAMLRLPFTDGMPNRVVAVRGHRFAYDMAIRMVGTRIVECEDESALAVALQDGDVAMVSVLGKAEERGAMRLERIVELARPRGIPVLVDAASELIERPPPWLARGADLVVYSGGKFLRGPQTSGLLLGNKALVQAAWRNASPHHSLGRPMKVSKEDVIGVLAALEHWFGERDDAAEVRRWHDDLAAIARQLADLDGVETAVLPPPFAQRVPTLEVRWELDRYGLNSEALRQLLLAGEPRIMLDDIEATAQSVQIDPFNLQPGEATMVGRALCGALRGAAYPTKTTPAVPGMDISGQWDFTVRFLRGSRRLRVILEQRGNDVSGRHDSDGFSGTVTGLICAATVRLQLAARFEGNAIVYSCEGNAAPDAMQGNAVFGATSASHAGPFNLRQHGAGTWEARRPA